MWTSIINDTIIDYFKNNYANLQRRFYDIEVEDNIQGGTLGLKHLLNIEPAHTDIIELFSAHPVATARGLAEKYYQKTGDLLIYVRTVIPNRELEIFRRGRKIATVFIESTTRDTFVKKEVDGIVRCFVSPKLYMISLLEKIYSPGDYDDRRDNIALFKQLFDITTQFVKYKPNDYNVLSEIVRDKVILYASEHHIIAISDKAPEDDVEFLSKYTAAAPIIHDVRLPSEYLLQKVVAKVGRMKYTFYNAGLFELIPYHELQHKSSTWMIGLPSVTARFLLIEDNTTYSLVQAKRLEYGLYYTSREHVEQIFSEEYPLDTFYGQYQDKSHIKKIMIKESEKYPLYFPYVNAMREIANMSGEMPDVQEDIEKYLRDELFITSD